MVNETEINDLFILVSGSLVTVLTVSAVIFFAFIFQRKLFRKETQFKEIERLLKKEELKSAYAFIEGREQERKQISQDLHDNLGSLLATMRLYLDRLKESTTYENQLIEKTISILNQTADETRRISHELGLSNTSQFGLLTSVSNLCNAIVSSKKLEVVSVLDINQALENSTSLHVYRIIQEMFSNTLKHAEAKKVRIEMTQIPNEYLSIIYEDDGKGFNQEHPKIGLGLKNIQSRVNILAGTLTIDSKEGQGTTFIIEIPLNQAYG